MINTVPLLTKERNKCGVKIHHKNVVTNAVTAITRDVGPAPKSADAKNKCEVINADKPP
ncbi:MAG: hypothetical protein ACLU99_09050 [Alphaproteobacteria bacterium]